MWAIKKSLSKKYSWVDSISKRKIQKDIIALPVKPGTTDIDFDYMEKYIKAIQKLTIRKVVKFKDQTIAATKKTVDNWCY